MIFNFDVVRQQATLLVTRLVYDGHTIWVKRRPDSKKTLWHRLQYILSWLIPIAILRPTSSAGGSASLAQEAERLQLFDAHHIAVPKVLALTADMLILSDTGTSLVALLDSMIDQQSCFQFIQMAIQNLAHLHQAGLCHGRPFLRDMTYRDDKIYMIDLEEDPEHVMSLPQAQARDIWLFINGAARYAGNDGVFLQRLFDHYRTLAPEAPIVELQKFVRLLKPVRILCEYLVMPWAGRDVKRAVLANKALEQSLLSKA
jgi:tRNA A-37 threonylcarbamoyl transferase component Bud32